MVYCVRHHDFLRLVIIIIVIPLIIAFSITNKLSKVLTDQNGKALTDQNDNGLTDQIRKVFTDQIDNVLTIAEGRSESENYNVLYEDPTNREIEKLANLTKSLSPSLMLSWLNIIVYHREHGSAGGEISKTYRDVTDQERRRPRSAFKTSPRREKFDLRAATKLLSSESSSSDSSGKMSTTAWGHASTDQRKNTSAEFLSRNIGLRTRYAGFFPSDSLEKSSAGRFSNDRHGRDSSAEIGSHIMQKRSAVSIFSSKPRTWPVTRNLSDDTSISSTPAFLSRHNNIMKRRRSAAKRLSRDESRTSETELSSRDDQRRRRRSYRSRKRSDQEKSGVTWMQWNAWGACSISCGGTGVRRRTRICADPERCRGVDRDVASCSSPACPPEAVWNEWGGWSVCSATCGAGKRTRTRFCLATSTKQRCPGNSTQSTTCVLNACKPEHVDAPLSVFTGSFTSLHCPHDPGGSTIKQLYWLTPLGDKITVNSVENLYKVVGSNLFVHEAAPKMQGVFHCVVERQDGKIDTGDVQLVVFACTDTNPCQNGGTCSQVTSNDVIKLDEQHRGEIHRSRLDDETSSRFRCACNFGYYGTFCQYKRMSNSMIAVVMLLSLFLFIACCSSLCWLCWRHVEMKEAQLQTELERPRPELERPLPELERPRPELERQRPELERPRPELDRRRPELERQSLLDEEARRRAEAARLAAEEQARQRAEADRLTAEAARRAAEEEARRRAEAERRAGELRDADEARRRATEEARRKAEEDKRLADAARRAKQAEDDRLHREMQKKVKNDSDGSDRSGETDWSQKSSPTPAVPAPGGTDWSQKSSPVPAPRKAPQSTTPVDITAGDENERMSKYDDDRFLPPVAVRARPSFTDKGWTRKNQGKHAKEEGDDRTDSDMESDGYDVSDEKNNARDLNNDAGNNFDSDAGTIYTDVAESTTDSEPDDFLKNENQRSQTRSQLSASLIYCNESPLRTSRTLQRASTRLSATRAGAGSCRSPCSRYHNDYGSEDILNEIMNIPPSRRETCDQESKANGCIPSRSCNNSLSKNTKGCVTFETTSDLSEPKRKYSIDKLCGSLEVCPKKRPYSVATAAYPYRSGSQLGESMDICSSGACPGASDSNNLSFMKNDTKKSQRSMGLCNIGLCPTSAASGCRTGNAMPPSAGCSLFDTGDDSSCYDSDFSLGIKGKCSSDDSDKHRVDRFGRQSMGSQNQNQIQLANDGSKISTRNIRPVESHNGVSHGMNDDDRDNIGRLGIEASRKSLIQDRSRTGKLIKQFRCSYLMKHPLRGRSAGCDRVSLNSKAGRNSKKGSSSHALKGNNCSSTLLAGPSRESVSAAASRSKAFSTTNLKRAVSKSVAAQLDPAISRNCMEAAVSSRRSTIGPTGSRSVLDTNDSSATDADRHVAWADSNPVCTTSISPSFDMDSEGNNQNDDNHEFDEANDNEDSSTGDFSDYNIIMSRRRRPKAARLPGGAVSGNCGESSSSKVAKQRSSSIRRSFPAILAFRAKSWESVQHGRACVGGDASEKRTTEDITEEEEKVEVELAVQDAAKGIKEGIGSLESFQNQSSSVVSAAKSTVRLQMTRNASARDVAVAKSASRVASHAAMREQSSPELSRSVSKSASHPVHEWSSPELGGSQQQDGRLSHAAGNEHGVRACHISPFHYTPPVDLDQRVTFDNDVCCNPCQPSLKHIGGGQRPSQKIPPWLEQESKVAAPTWSLLSAFPRPGEGQVRASPSRYTLHRTPQMNSSLLAPQSHFTKDRKKMICHEFTDQNDICNGKDDDDDFCSGVCDDDDNSDDLCGDDKCSRCNRYSEATFEEESRSSIYHLHDQPSRRNSDGRRSTGGRCGRSMGGSRSRTSPGGHRSSYDRVSGTSGPAPRASRSGPGDKTSGSGPWNGAFICQPYGKASTDINERRAFMCHPCGGASGGSHGGGRSTGDVGNIEGASSMAGLLSKACKREKFDAAPYGGRSTADSVGGKPISDPEGGSPVASTEGSIPAGASERAAPSGSPEIPAVKVWADNGASNDEETGAASLVCPTEHLKSRLTSEVVSGNSGGPLSRKEFSFKSQSVAGVTSANRPIAAPGSSTNVCTVVEDLAGGPGASSSYKGCEASLSKPGNGPHPGGQSLMSSLCHEALRSVQWASRATGLPQVKEFVSRTGGGGISTSGFPGSMSQSRGQCYGALKSSGPCYDVFHGVRCGRDNVSSLEKKKLTEGGGQNVFMCHPCNFASKSSAGNRSYLSSQECGTLMGGPCGGISIGISQGKKSIGVHSSSIPPDQVSESIGHSQDTETKKFKSDEKSKGHFQASEEGTGSLIGRLKVYPMNRSFTVFPEISRAPGHHEVQVSLDRPQDEEFFVRHQQEESVDYQRGLISQPQTEDLGGRPPGEVKKVRSFTAVPKGKSMGHPLLEEITNPQPQDAIFPAQQSEQKSGGESNMASAIARSFAVVPKISGLPRGGASVGRPQEGSAKVNHLSKAQPGDISSAARPYITDTKGLQGRGSIQPESCSTDQYSGAVGRKSNSFQVTSTKVVLAGRNSVCGRTSPRQNISQNLDQRINSNSTASRIGGGQGIRMNGDKGEDRNDAVSNSLARHCTTSALRSGTTVIFAGRNCAKSQTNNNSQSGISQVSSGTQNRSTETKTAFLNELHAELRRRSLLRDEDDNPDINGNTSDVAMTNGSRSNTNANNRNNERMNMVLENTVAQQPCCSGSPGKSPPPNSSSKSLRYSDEYSETINNSLSTCSNPMLAAPFNMLSSSHAASPAYAPVSSYTLTPTFAVTPSYVPASSHAPLSSYASTSSNAPASSYAPVSFGISTSSCASASSNALTSSYTGSSTFNTSSGKYAEFYSECSAEIAKRRQLVRDLFSVSLKDQSTDTD